MKKRIFALALVCFMLVSMLPVNGIHVHAAEATKEPDWHIGFGHTAEEAEALGQDVPAEVVSTIPSTCGKPGYEMHKCPWDGCNKLVKGDIIPPSEGDDHAYVKVEAKAPDCGMLPDINKQGSDDKAAGWIEHYKCTNVGCDERFLLIGAEPDGTPIYKSLGVIAEDKIIDNAELRVDAEHTLAGEACSPDAADRTCTACEKELSATGHQFGVMPDLVAPSADGKSGTATFKCDFCEATKVVEIPACDPHADKLAAKQDDPATCTTAGTIECWYCKTCDKYYVDQYGLVEISEEAAVRPALGHKIENRLYNAQYMSKDPTCKDPGVEYGYCTRESCPVKKANNGADTVVSNDLPATDHVVGPMLIAPTCVAYGRWVNACLVCKHEVSVISYVAPYGHLPYTSAINMIAADDKLALLKDTMVYYNPYTTIGTDATAPVNEVVTYRLYLDILSGPCATCGNAAETDHQDGGKCTYVPTISDAYKAVTLTIKGGLLLQGIEDGEKTYVRYDWVNGKQEAQEFTWLDFYDVKTKKATYLEFQLTAGESLVINASSTMKTEDNTYDFTGVNYKLEAIGKDGLTTTKLNDTMVDQSTTLNDYLSAGTEVKDDGGNVLYDPAGCETRGTMKYTCGCGTSIAEILDAKGHDAEQITVPSTCTAEGYSFWICKRENCELKTGDNDQFGNRIYILKNGFTATKKLPKYVIASAEQGVYVLTSSLQGTDATPVLITKAEYENAGYDATKNVYVLITRGTSQTQLPNGLQGTINRYWYEQIYTYAQNAYANKTTGVLVGVTTYNDLSVSEQANYAVVPAYVLKNGNTASATLPATLTAVDFGKLTDETVKAKYERLYVDGYKLAYDVYDLGAAVNPVDNNSNEWDTIWTDYATGSAVTIKKIAYALTVGEVVVLKGEKNDKSSYITVIDESHHYVKVFVNKLSCEAVGTYLLVCTDCGVAKPATDGKGYFYDDEPKIDHIFTCDDYNKFYGYEVTEAHSYTDSGETLCAVCGLEENAVAADNAKVHGEGEGQHKYEGTSYCGTCGCFKNPVEVQEWICNEQDGISYERCHLCKKTYKDTESKGEHEFVPNGVTGESCKYGHYHEVECQNEGCTAIDYVTDKPYQHNPLDIFDSVDEANALHNLDVGSVEIYADATCVSPKVVSYICLDCKEVAGRTHRVLVTEGNRAGHQYCGVGDYKCDDADCDHTSGDRVEASCMKDGNTEYGYCLKCGNVEKVILPALGHMITKKTETSAEQVLLPGQLTSTEKLPTCTADGYTRHWTCLRGEECDDIVNVKTVDGEKVYETTYTYTISVNGTNVKTSVESVNGVVAKTVIAASGHNLQVWNLPNQTCAHVNADGTVCGMYAGNEVHGTGTDTHNFTAVRFANDATCYEDGFELWGCTNEDCEFFVDFEDGKLEISKGVILNYVAMFKHMEDGESAIVAPECTKDGYCDLCKSSDISSEELEALGHDYENLDALGHINAAGVEFSHICSEFVKDLEEYAENNSGAVLDTICVRVFETNAQGNVVRRCCVQPVADNPKTENINETVIGHAITLKCETAAGEDGHLVHSQNGAFQVITVAEGDCMNPNVVIKTCSNCAYSFYDKYSNGDHKWEERPVSFTVESDGTDYSIGGYENYCTVCGLTAEQLFEAGKITEAEYEDYKAVKFEGDDLKKGVQLHLTVDNAHRPGAGFTDSTLVKVVVSMESFSQVELYSFIASLKYDDAVMDFLPEMTRSLNEAFCFADTFVNDKGYVNIIGAAHDTNGDPVNVKVEQETALVELYFRVNSKSATEADFRFIKNADKQPDSDEHYTIQAIDAEGEDVLIAGDYNTIEIKQFLNGHIDGKDVGEHIDLKDMYMAVELFQNEGYNVVLDVDQDGVMELSDIMALVNYISGKLTYEDLWAMDCDGGDACTNEENPCEEDVVEDTEPEVPGCPCIQWWLNDTNQAS